MSYCRWSSDNWRCDLYCYGSSQGYETHVAGNRVVGDIPQEPRWDEEINEEWMARHKAVMTFLDTAERKPIGGPFDGASFTDETLEAFHGRLLALRAAGYRFPDYVLDGVREEIAERSKEGAGEP